MYKILVPTDFSANANKALDYAVQICKHLNAELMILHANQEVSSNISFPIDPVNFPYVFDGEAILKKLAELKQRAGQDSTLIITTHIYEGDITASIIKASIDLNASLIIMGTLGNSGFVEKLFGSISALVIGKSLLPLLVVPLMAEWKLPEKILFAVNDFDEEAAHIDMLITIADAFKAKTEMAVFISEDSAAVEFVEKARGIEFYKEKLTDHYKNTELKIIRLHGSDLQHSLEEYVSSNNIDILAMVSHKRRNFLERLFSKSITKKISYHTDIPLLVLPV